jgi:hypothetical protein
MQKESCDELTICHLAASLGATLITRNANYPVAEENEDSTSLNQMLLIF